MAVGWLSLWLGLIDIGVIAGVGNFWENGGIRSSMLPPWALGGLKDVGAVWESAIEDALFVFVEGWQGNKWEALKTLSQFPLIVLAGQDEL